jgi:hypothetical protein
MKEIQLYRRKGSGRWGNYIPIDKVALVDDEDYERVLGVTEHWILHSEGYAYTNVGRRGLLMHRFILGLTDSKVHTDHADHNRLNNQKDNIRACSQAENNSNLPFRGVGRRGDKWRAWTPTPTQHLGIFDTEEEAKKALLDWYQTQERQHVSPPRSPAEVLSACCEAQVVRHGRCHKTNKQRYRCTKCRKVSHKHVTAT